LEIGVLVMAAKLIVLWNISWLYRVCFYIIDIN